MSDKKQKTWKKLKEAYEQADAAEASERMLDEGDPNAAAAPQAPETALDYPSRESLEAQLLAAEQKAQENHEKALRAVAELDNVRKRAEREVSQARLYGQEKLISALLPVLDSLEQALVSVKQDLHTELWEGVDLTLKLLLSILEKQDVSQINPEGQPFNPKEHEAMTTQVDEAIPSNTVITVFQKWYKLNDRVIRAARVVVSKGA